MTHEWQEFPAATNPQSGGRPKPYIARLAELEAEGWEIFQVDFRNGVILCRRSDGL